MYVAVLLFFVLSPLAGIILMELGAYGADVAEEGYFNGASFAYGMHALVLLGVYQWVWNKYQRGPRAAIWDSVLPHRWIFRYTFRRVESDDPGRRSNFMVLGTLSLLINVGVVVVLLFGVGGISVLQGELAKNEFRSTLGDWGLFAYFSRDFLAPGLAALLALMYRETRPGMAGLFLLLGNFGVAGLGGLLWGFKASFIFALMPALVILLPRIRFVSGVVVPLVVLGSMAASATLFERVAIEDSIMTVLNRATVLQGDSAWKVWDIYASGEPLPEYSRTLLSILGGRILQLMGINITGDLATYVEYNWAFLLSYTVGTTVDSMGRGNTMTGTLFSEGLIALGAPGYLIFSLVAGLLVGFNRIVLEDSIHRRLWHVSVFACLYFATSIVTWINSGGVQALLQLAFLVNYTIIFVLSYLLLTFSQYRLEPRARGDEKVVPMELAPDVRN